MAQQVKANITFSEVQKNPEFIKLAPEQKQEAALQYFADRVATRPEYKALKPEQQQEALNQFQTQYKFTPIKAGEINTELAAQNGTQLTPQSQLGVRPQQEADLQPRQPQVQQPAQPQSNPILEQLQGFGRGLAKGASAGSLYPGAARPNTEFATGAGDFIGSAATNLLPYFAGPVAGAATNTVYAGLREANREIDQGKTQLNPYAIGAQSALGLATGLIPASLGTRTALRIGSGAALGGLAGASGNAIEQLTDTGNIDLGQLAPSALTGLVLGAGAGALNRAGKNAIPRQERPIGLNAYSKAEQRLGKPELLQQPQARQEPSVRQQQLRPSQYKAEVTAQIAKEGRFDDGLDAIYPRGNEVDKPTPKRAAIQEDDEAEIYSLFNPSSVLEAPVKKQVTARASLRAIKDDLDSVFQTASSNPASEQSAYEVMDAFGYARKKVSTKKGIGYKINFLGKIRTIEENTTIGGFLDKMKKTGQDPIFALAKRIHQEKATIGILDEYKRLNGTEEARNLDYTQDTDMSQADSAVAAMDQQHAEKQRWAYKEAQEVLEELDIATTNKQVMALIARAEKETVAEELPDGYWDILNKKAAKAFEDIEADEAAMPTSPTAKAEQVIKAYTPTEKAELEAALNELYGTKETAVNKNEAKLAEIGNDIKKTVAGDKTGSIDALTRMAKFYAGDMEFEQFARSLKNLTEAEIQEIGKRVGCNG